MSRNESETIGYCEGLCGGLLSHHLIDGLCPQCWINPNIKPPQTDDYDGVPLGVEAGMTEHYRAVK